MVVDKVLTIAKAEVGYLEKKSNSNLDDKTANAGTGNYTKYARDLDAIEGFYNGKKNGYPWCDVFVDWCFVQAYGVENAKKLLGQPDKSLGAGCSYSARYYKDKGQFHTTPKVGDQIFFGKKGDESHTGIVYKVDNKYVYTIEGNTSSASGVVANGGGVFEKKYSLTHSQIAGYGRPNYTESVADKPKTEPKKEETYTRTQFIKDVQASTGAKVDGIAGSETISKTVTVSARKNCTHKVVKYIQKYLNAIGYSCGKVDGIIGSKTTAAIKSYQKANGCVVDGEITARNKTWKNLLGML